MKKLKYVVLGLIILLGLGVVIYQVSDFSKLAVVKGNITSSQSNESHGTFKAKEAEKIKISCKSDVKEGDLNLSLLDSNKNIIDQFNINSDSKLEVVLEKDDEYTLSEKYDSFVGDFNMNVKKIK